MWTAASAAVFVPLIGLIILACFASTRQVGKWKGWTRISVKLFGLGYTIERYNIDQPTDPEDSSPSDPAESTLAVKAPAESIGGESGEIK
jgi:hypothetical protein